jgi:predicted nucleic acid-binding protein
VKAAVDPDELVVGIDASVLIDLVGGRVLTGLNELFPTVAVPALVKEEIRRGVAGHPVNKGILRSAWLLSVAAEDPDDLQLIADLHSGWGSAPPNNAGEAELIALCRRHGWIGLLEDSQARRTAHREGVHAVRLSTCAIAAAACGVITADRAWGLHRGHHGRRPANRPPAIGTKPADRANFDHAIEVIGRLVTKLGSPPWPEVLRHPDLKPGQLDQLIVKVGSSQGPTPASY